MLQNFLQDNIVMIQVSSAPLNGKNLLNNQL